MGEPALFLLMRDYWQVDWVRERDELLPALIGQPDGTRLGRDAPPLRSGGQLVNYPAAAIDCGCIGSRREHARTFGYGDSRRYACTERGARRRYGHRWCHQDG